MKAIFTYLLLLVTSTGFANEIIKYRVEGKLTGELKAKYAYLRIFHPGRQAQLVQASITNNSFVFTGQLNQPGDELCRASIIVTNKPGYTSKTIIEALKEINFDYRNFILDGRVNIEIKHSTRDAIVTGSERNSINNLFEAVGNKYLTGLDNLTELYEKEAAASKNDEAAFEKLRAEYNQQSRHLQDVRTEKLLTLAAKYPYSPQALPTIQMIATLNGAVSGRYQQMLENTWSTFPEALKRKKEAVTIISLIDKAATSHKLVAGSAIPEYTFNDEKGNTITISSYRGKYLFVDFWTSWCGPCKAEHHYMRQAYNKFKSQNFEILQVSLDEKREKWVKALNQGWFPWTSVLHKKGWDKGIENLFEVTGVPTNYLVDPDGKIIARNLRGEALERKLSEIFLAASPKN
jgi:thiol-disulfide isomerase/thioredoxin